MYQQTIIVGNLGRDPEMRYTPGGKAVTDFSVAVNRRYQNADGQWEDSTTWFKVTCWGKLAETTNQFLTKGRQVMVIGRVEASAWMGQDGQPRATLELTAQDVRFLGSRDGSPDMADAGSVAHQEEDIPF